MKKTTLSPFETARTFYTLRLHDAPEHLDTPALLKEVEGKICLLICLCRGVSTWEQGREKEVWGKVETCNDLTRELL